MMKGPDASSADYKKDLKSPLTEISICKNSLAISRLTIKTKDESYTMGTGDEKCSTITVDDGDCLISFG
jgi:hypothetical protein